MRARFLLLAGAGLVAVAVLARRSRTAEGVSEPAPGCGWASCSAPSARWYDAVFSGPLRGLHQHMAADLVAVTGDAAITDVLEIGPGPGMLAVELARLVPSMRIAGVDVDPAMVDRATTRAARSGLADRISVRTGDVAELPFPDGSFDLVTSTFSVHHWADARSGFAQIRRVLRPGGRAVIYDLPDWWGRLERGAGPLADSVTEAGFTDISVARFRWPWRVPLAVRLEARVANA